MRTVIIYPGRFQPMLYHHKLVYDYLSKTYNADVYVATTNKVELPSSPFSFDEKKKIMIDLGVPEEKILQVRNPYNASEYDFNPDTTALIFAVGAKDSSRFRFTFDGTNTFAVGKSGKKQYMQPMSCYNKQPEPMTTAGYILFVDNVLGTNNTVASATQFRHAIKTNPNIKVAKRVCEAKFGKYSNNVFNLIYSKIKE